MSRRDAHLDAMLRNLVATYYHSVHGSESSAAVLRAVESVTEADGRDRQTLPGQDGDQLGGADGREPWQPRHRWCTRDVMTADVVVVRKSATYHEIAWLMGERGVSALPVLDDQRRVFGMVSETDLLPRQEGRYGRLGTGLPMRTLQEVARATAGTAGELMTSPPITIHPDAPLGQRPAS